MECASNAIGIFLAPDEPHLHLPKEFALHRALATCTVHREYAPVAFGRVRARPVQQLGMKEDARTRFEIDDDLVGMSRLVVFREQDAEILPITRVEFVFNIFLMRTGDEDHGAVIGPCRVKSDPCAHNPIDGAEIEVGLVLVKRMVNVIQSRRFVDHHREEALDVRTNDLLHHV